MNLYNFITHEEIETVAEKVKNKTDFKIERKCKGYKFDINSSRAGVDFDKETKKGDYILGIGFQASDRGCGGPISGKEIRKLEDIEGCTKFIDDYLKKRKIEGYETIDEGQISLFEMGI